MPVELTVDQQALQALGRALKAEADGKKLRRDLLKNLREAMEPIRDEARSNLLGVASAGLSAGESLRSAVADEMKIEARLSGRATGARLRVPRKRGMPRGFLGAGKALNKKKGWRHPVFGDTNVWVDQVARPANWFDDANESSANRAEARRKVIEAMDAMAARIARKGPFKS